MTLTAIPTEGYHFVAWDEEGVEVSTDAEYTFTAEANRSLIGVFDINIYTLEYTAGANGSLTGVTLQEVEHGGDGTPVEAIPDPGYSFTGWSDAVMVNPRTDTNVQDDISVTATFAINSYAITAEPNDPAFGEVDGAGTYDHGEEVTLTATPYTGAEFVEWTEGGVQVFTDASYSFTATEERNLVAHFAVKTYEITAAPNNPALGEVTGGGIYNHGDLVTVTATPATGYNFVEWTENGTTVSTDATYSFTAIGDRDLVAHFVLKTYTISATPANPDYGSVSGGGTYDHGATVNLIATPNAGYHFVFWEEGGDEVSTDPEYTFIAEASRSLVAVFEINTYTLEYIAGENGSLTGDILQEVEHGSDGTPVEAIPDPGYSFVGWSDAVMDNPRTDTNVDENISVTADFAIDTFEITATANNDTYGTVTGGGIYEHGATVTLSATPATGYEFVEWKEGGVQVSTDATYSFTATGDRDLVAHFAVKTYTITAEPNNPALGEVTGGGIYNHGDPATLTATPFTGAEFVEWTEGGAVVMDGGSPAGPVYSFSATKDRDLVAHFSAIDTGIPGILFLADQLVTVGDTLCFGATKTIYTAGDEGDFMVMEDTHVDLIAGENIVMLPGTHIHAGAYVNARIAPNGPFCETEENDLFADDRDKQDTDTAGFITNDQSYTAITGIQDFYKLYPNPTEGMLTLELFDVDEACNIQIQVFNLTGQLLIDSTLPALNSHNISISDYDPGMYIVRVVHCDRIGFTRIQKR